MPTDQDLLTPFPYVGLSIDCCVRSSFEILLLFIIVAREKDDGFEDGQDSNEVPRYSTGTEVKAQLKRAAAGSRITAGTYPCLS